MENSHPVAVNVVRVKGCTGLAEAVAASAPAFDLAVALGNDVPCPDTVAA